MAIQVKLRGGTYNEHETFIGSPREVTVDTTSNTLRVHDGVTSGGHPLTPLNDFLFFKKDIIREVEGMQNNIAQSHNHDDRYSSIIHKHDDLYVKLIPNTGNVYSKILEDHNGLCNSVGDDGGYFRTTKNGLLPYRSGGYSSIGANSWRFLNGFFNNLDADYCDAKSFHSKENSYFDKEFHANGEIYTKGTGVVRRQNNVFIQVDALGVQNTNNSNWLLINCYKSNHVFGVDLWYSDKTLKENIVPINPISKAFLQSNDASDKVGLDLITSLPHYSYNYKKSSGLGNEHFSCGYIAQDLKALNSNLVREVPQKDGSTLLEPRASAIIPHLSRAIQEQSDIIKSLEERILKLESAK